MFHLVLAILAIGLLIVVHEAGHYFVALWCKMRVERFSIGFGPAILRLKRPQKWGKPDAAVPPPAAPALQETEEASKGRLANLAGVATPEQDVTEFTIGPIPFGGFVQIAGMNLGDEVDKNDKHAYPNRPVWQRFATIFAGPATNYLFAMFLALVLFAGKGVETVWYAVGSVQEGFDAVGKLEVGDRITHLNDVPLYQMVKGEPVAPKDSLKERMRINAGNPIEITVLRKGTPTKVTVTPKADTVKQTDGSAAQQFRLGIGLAQDGEWNRVGLGSSLGMAVSYPFVQSAAMLRGFQQMFQKGPKIEDFSSVVEITAMVKHAFEIGWVEALKFLMFLNVALGLFNLFPLPALDGGRLVFLGYEMVTRRRANPKVEATVHVVGMLALLVLMVFVTYDDIAGILRK